MRRRDVLVGTGALALTAALPLPALACATAVREVDYCELPIGKIYEVEHAFDIVEAWGFTLEEKIKTLGFWAQGNNDLASLRNEIFYWAIDHDGPNLWKRIKLLTVIRQRLDELFGGNMAEQLEQMEGPLNILLDFSQHRIWDLYQGSLRDLLISGYMGQYQVAVMLGANPSKLFVS